MVKTSKRLLSAVLCIMTFMFAFYGIQLNQDAAAAQTNWKFDLGANAQSGYTGVSASQGYNASLGYGFSNTSGVKNVGASGNGALSDAVQFTDNKSTFNVDLPKGLYSVGVTLGNTNRTSVYMENMLQIVNMTGNNAYDSIIIPVTDGQLNIRAAAGKDGYAYTISLIEITQISTDPTMPKTIWFCGDSTVCNYYPIATSAQAGWGQVFSKYIDNSWNVRDMAASGQFAKGFVTGGQFDAIEYYGKSGDIYIISIGINDTNYSNAEEYYNVVTDMTKRAKAKGMKVILVKQQGRNGDAQRKPLLTGRWFGGELDKIGAEQNVQVMDLFTLWQDHCIAIGADATTALYMPNDGLHPNRQGAMKLAELAASQIDWDSVDSASGAEIAEDTAFIIKNKNSGLCMYAEKAEKGANVYQSESSVLNENTLWTVKKADKGYYYIYSKLDKGQYLLDVTEGKTANGTNIELYEYSESDAQLFKFVANSDGSYCITTKCSKDKACVEVKSALTDSGANVQEWEKNGHACQSWILEPIKNSESISEISVGDLNNDGIINIFDYLLLKRIVNDIPVSDYNWHDADLNSDGDIKTDDLTALGKFIVCEEESFEAAEKCSSFYYANEAIFSQGVLESTNAGFKKDSYVNLDNIVGSFIHWNVTAPVEGNYYFEFSVANGSAANRIMKIEVNGAKDYWLQDFLSTSAWTTWTKVGIVLPLKSGMNDIRMTSNTNEGGPNIDTLYIEKTDEPIAGVATPGNNTDTPGSGTNIFIAGDSTVQTYNASYAPQQGWGAFLGENLPEGYTVQNRAIAGRSSKSFFDNGRLDTILNDMKAGDYLLVQFAINDADYTKAERYAPVSDKIPGTDGSFEYYIAKYIEGAQAKGGKPVLVTTVLGLKAYNSSTKKFTGSYDNYCNAMKKLAAHYKIPCIDLNTAMVNHYNSIGYDAAYKYHMCSTGSNDMTHFTETGASAVAKLVANELKKLF